MTAVGALNNATNIGGNGNGIIAINNPDPTKNRLHNVGGNVAFNNFGHQNFVSAGPGPAAIAGAVRQTSKNVSQSTPGINISNRRHP